MLLDFVHASKVSPWRHDVLWAEREGFEPSVALQPHPLSRLRRRVTVIGDQA